MPGVLGTNDEAFDSLLKAIAPAIAEIATSGGEIATSGGEIATSGGEIATPGGDEGSLAGSLPGTLHRLLRGSTEVYCQGLRRQQRREKGIESLRKLMAQVSHIRQGRGEPY